MADKSTEIVTDGAVFHVPEQKPSPPQLPAHMKASIATYPPLGRITQLQSSTVTCLAVLDIPQDQARDPWEVALWHSADQDTGESWIETPLKAEKHGASCLQPLTSSSSRLHFRGQLSGETLFKFTVKFRRGPEEGWRWVRDEQGMSDGQVIISNDLSTSAIASSFDGILKGIDPKFSIQSTPSQAPGTRLWAITSPIKAAEGDHSSIDESRLGLPFGGFLKWFALIRIWTPWIAPRQGGSHLALQEDAITCAFVNTQGRHLVLLAISGPGDISSVFRSDEAGHVVLRVRNDDNKEGVATVLAAVGHDFESANAAVMYHARNVMQSQSPARLTQEDIRALEDQVKPQWMENWYDGLGYCTWNALGQRLTDEKILNALAALEKSEIKITSLIIDDNWQNIDYKGPSQFQHGWNDFEAEPKAFPGGLKSLVSRIRSDYPQIQHVAVWHALLGYWGGIAADGALAKRYKTQVVTRENAPRRTLPISGEMTVIAQSDVGKFYDDFYRFLSSCGIDGVKTDAQFMIDTIVSAKDRKELINEYLDAWHISSLRYFSIKAMSCMSQTPHIIFHSQLPRNGPTILCRNSDDFFPQIPSSHPWHIWTNAHNTLLTQHLNILPDWDMFQTVHSYSSFHAAARCVSGGPIYITDEPGQHDLALINQMTGTSPRGKTVIFRPSVLGKSTDAYVGYQDDILLKVGAYHGAAVTGTPIMGIFNVSTRPLTELVPLQSFAGVLSSMTYIIRAHSTGLITSPVRTIGDDDAAAAMVAVSLEERGWEILTVYPLSTFQGGQLGTVHAANLGLLGKMTGGAAVTRSDFDLEHNGRVCLTTSVKALGVLGLYVSTLPQMTIANDFFGTILGQPIPPVAVTLDGSSEFVVKIDIAKAWNELGLQPGFNNEVEVKLYFDIDG